MTFISKKIGQFTYFDLQLGKPNWADKDILDFGGNIGNILQDPNSTIEEERYWCLDVVPEAIEQGKTLYPKGHWHFYNRYAFAFNPNGILHLEIPELSQQFDYIVAYSVFSNTTCTDMLELVEQLTVLLKPGSRFAFTFIDPNFHAAPDGYNGSNLMWRLEKLKREYPTIDIDALRQKAENANWLILVNADDIYIEREDIKPYPPEQQQYHHTFHSASYIQSLFPHATILPPASGQMQHCCIIRG